MTEYVICDKEEITSIADTVRSATGTTETMSLSGIDAGVKSMKPVQPDWSQNDETARDYVKNRTHYEEKEIVTLFEGTERDDGNHLGIYITDKELEVGQEYTVIVDNETYNVTVFNRYFLPAPTLGAPLIGVDENVGAGLFDFSEYPFGMFNSGSELLVVFSDTNEHFVKLMTTNTVVHKLDEKFLPFGEFKAIMIRGNYSDGQFRCNLSFEEAFNWVESNLNMMLGIYRDQNYVEFFYLSYFFGRKEDSGERYIEMVFKTLGGDNEKHLWYLDDGTIAKSNPYDSK